MRDLLITVVLLAGLLSQAVEASVRRLCLVSYETRSGYSEEYRMEVQFSTGRELNQATRSFRFGVFSNYALLWFGDGEVAILEIDSFLLGVGEDFDSEDFRRLFRFLGETTATQVNSGRGSKWRIKGKEYLRWVDPREK